MPVPSTELIAGRSALARGLIADRFADTEMAALGLRRMKALMDRLGNPQGQFRTIHIAGSKGKGTTTHIAAALLAGHGYRTGRFTSPHLRSWNERIAIDDCPISEEPFTDVLERIDHEMSGLERGQPEIGKYNAFELLTSAALIHFAERSVDFAVIEVGLGGRFDSTNVVRAAVSVITRIELEHEEILGPGLRSIAWNKAGIITTDAPVVVASQEPEAIRAIDQEAAETGALIYLEGRDWSLEPNGSDLSFRFGDYTLDDLSLNLPGAHNMSNAGAALTAVLLATSPEPLDPSVTRRDIAEISIPGRFERVFAGTSSRAWVLDVAHTRESIARLLDSASSEPDLDRFAVMFALLDDKPAEDILETIASRTTELILPEINHPRAIPARRLAEIARTFGVDAHVAPDLESAVALATTLDRPIIVTGSFTLVGHVLGALAQNRNPIA